MHSSPSRFTLARLAPAFALACLNPTNATAAELPKNATPVLAAMRAELAHSTTAFTSQSQPPYFLSYEITENRRVSVNSSFGALMASTENTTRVLDIDLRVGSPALDNTHAIRFYQRRGWRFAALHKGNVDRARALIPEIPLLGFDDIQVRDEIEFERWLA